jgi:hypothetical protein
VQILENEHERAALRERFEEAPPGGEVLVAAIPAWILLPREPDERPETAFDPVRALGVGD